MLVHAPLVGAFCMTIVPYWQCERETGASGGGRWCMIGWIISPSFSLHCNSIIYSRLLPCFTLCGVAVGLVLVHLFGRRSRSRYLIRGLVCLCGLVWAPVLLPFATVTCFSAGSQHDSHRFWFQATMFWAGLFSSINFLRHGRNGVLPEICPQVVL